MRDHLGVVLGKEPGVIPGICAVQTCQSSTDRTDPKKEHASGLADNSDSSDHATLPPCLHVDARVAIEY
jgi:hypothetical protein